MKDINKGIEAILNMRTMENIDEYDEHIICVRKVL